MCFALQKDCLAFFIHDSKHVFWSGQSSGISIPNGDSRYDGSVRGTSSSGHGSRCAARFGSVVLDK